MNRLYLWILITLLLWGFSAQSQLTIDGQFRSRAELRDGYREVASDVNYPAPLVSQRSRVILNFADSSFDFRFSAQDARVWGQNWNAMASNAVHLYEAWAAFKPNRNLTFKLGRQELRYDDQRIMAARDYSITGVTYDAALLMYSNKELGVNLHWGTMINNLGETNFLSLYNTPLSFKYMSFLWYDMKVSDNLRFNALNLFDLTQNPGDVHTMYGRNTLGANGIFNLTDNLGGRIGGYYQMGSSWVSNGAFGETNRKIRAYSYNVTLWYSVSDNLKLSATSDVYSGNDWSENSEHYTAFNRIMCAGHTHMGFMDYFTSADLREVRWAGINDFFLRADYKANSKLNFQATLHYLLLDKPYLLGFDPIGYLEVDKPLGTEIDVIVNYKVAPSFTIQGAFMMMLPTETLERVKLSGGESEFSYFSYISFLFTPKFFKWEGK